MQQLVCAFIFHFISSLLAMLMNTQFTQFTNLNSIRLRRCLLPGAGDEEWEWNRSDPISHTFHISPKIYTTTKMNIKNENERSLRDTKVYAVKSQKTIWATCNNFYIITVRRCWTKHETEIRLKRNYGTERKGKSEKVFQTHSNQTVDEVWQFQDWKYFVSSSTVFFLSFSLPPIFTLPTTQQKKYNIFFFYSFQFCCWPDTPATLSMLVAGERKRMWFQISFAFNIDGFTMRSAIHHTNSCCFGTRCLCWIIKKTSHQTENYKWPTL